MIKPTIRETELRDFEDVLRILREEKMIESELTLTRFKEMLKRNKGFFFVAEKDGEVVGTIFGSHDGGLTGHIYKLAVSREDRRQGIGRLLAERLIETFFRAKIYWLFAHVDEDNIPSIGLFKSLGFGIRTPYCLMDLKRPPSRPVARKIHG